jgi:hypothetical protein
LRLDGGGGTFLFGICNFSETSGNGDNLRLFYYPETISASLGRFIWRGSKCQSGAAITAAS